MVGEGTALEDGEHDAITAHSAVTTTETRISVRNTNTRLLGNSNVVVVISVNTDLDPSKETSSPTSINRGCSILNHFHTTHTDQGSIPHVRDWGRGRSILAGILSYMLFYHFRASFLTVTHLWQSVIISALKEIQLYISDIWIEEYNDPLLKGAAWGSWRQLVSAWLCTKTKIKLYLAGRNVNALFHVTSPGVMAQRSCGCHCLY